MNVSIKHITSANFPARLRRNELLGMMGLPANAKKPEAHRAYKSMLVAARRENNEEAQKLLSQIWAYLKKRLANLCAGCGVVISPSSRKCRLCHVTTRIIALCLLTSSVFGATNSPSDIRAKLLAIIATNRPPVIGRTNPVEISVTINSPAANARRILQAKTNVLAPWVTIADCATNLVYQEPPVGSKFFRAVTTNSSTVSLAWEGTGTNTIWLAYGNHSGVRSTWVPVRGSPALLKLPPGTNYVVASYSTNFSNEFIAVVTPTNTFVTPKLSLK